MPDNAMTSDLATGVRVARDDAGYRSSFQHWNRRASVRVAPEREVRAPESGMIWFPPELTPAVAHPLVTARGGTVADRLLLHRLYEYMHFTSELEAAAVIPVASSLARGRADVCLPLPMRADAHKIVTDEAWHAQFSFDLINQASAVTRVPFRPPGRAQFLDRLDRIRQALYPDVRELVDIMFAVISETLISSILVDIPRDKRVTPAVRDVVRDHAEDEGRHHAYFRSLLQLVWPTLSHGQRRAIGPVLPDMIFAFLEPDYPAAARALVEVGFDAPEVEEILVDSFPRRTVRQNVRSAAQPTIRYLRAAGALDFPETHDAFVRSGLVDG